MVVLCINGAIKRCTAWSRIRIALAKSPSRGLILRTTVGSVVHGLSNPGTDDRDELGVCIEPPEYLLGFKRFEHFVYRTQPEGEPSGPGDLDLVVYGLRKYCQPDAEGQPHDFVAVVRRRRTRDGAN